MLHKFKIIHTIAFLSFYGVLFSQSGIKLTDYFNNPSLYNPAYTGVTDSSFIKGTYSTQWVGFEGAPTTQTLDAQLHFHNEKHAVGLSILNDDFGAVKNMNTEANYALHLYLNDDTKLILGLKVGFSHFKIDYQQLTIHDPNEEIYNDGNTFLFKPIIGVGAYLHQKKWFVGIAAPNLISHTINDLENTSFYVKKPHFYSVAGYTTSFKKEYTFRAQVLNQIISGAPVATLLSTSVTYQNSILIGVHFQPKSLLGIFTNYAISDMTSFGYGYDVSLQDLFNHSGGSHSFSVSFNILNAAKKWNDRFRESKPYFIQ